MPNDAGWDDRGLTQPVKSRLTDLRDRFSARMTNMRVGAVLETLQVHFPPVRALHDLVLQMYLRTRRLPFDHDFQCLARIEFAPDEVMIDVGANRGQSIDAMRLYHPGQPIVAFEPNPNLAVKLRNRFQNDDKLVIHNVGLGDTAGEFTLYVPCYNGLEFDSKGALTFGERQCNHIRENIIGFDKGRLNYKTMRCQVWELDRFKLKPRFIKIDTEGFELSILHGAVETIDAHHPILLIANTVPCEVIELLGPMGYGEFHYDGRLCQGPGSRNTLYINLGGGRHTQ
jgi:FkbM family methyltransferase